MSKFYVVSHQKETKWSGTSHEEILGWFVSEELAIEHTKVLIAELEEEYKNQGFDKIETIDNLEFTSYGALFVNKVYDKVWHSFSIDKLTANEIRCSADSLM